MFSLLLKYSTLINFFLILNHFTFKLSTTTTPACLLLTLFYTQYTTNMFLRYFIVWVCNIVFHRFSSVQADQDSTWESVCSRNPTKRRCCSGWSTFPTADWRSWKDASKEWNGLWEPAGDFQQPVCFKHVKQQLCISLPEKDGNYLPFTCIFKASSLNKFTSSSEKSNKSLTTRQELEHGISHVQKLNLFFHRIFMHIE